MASFGICSRGGPRSTVDKYGWSKTIVRCPCIPTSTLETFGEKISASTGSSNEISGLLGGHEFRNRVLADSRVTNWRQVGTALGLCIPRNESRGCCCVCFQGLARRSRRVRRRFVRGSREISLAPSLYVIIMASNRQFEVLGLGSLRPPNHVRLHTENKTIERCKDTNGCKEMLFDRS